jgi:hypothetical protein
MLRLSLGLFCLLGSLSPAWATLDARRESSAARHAPVPVPDTLVRGSSGAATDKAPDLQLPKPATADSEDFEINDATEVLLDGKPCKYEAIPSSAVITNIDVASDRKTVLKIHFRSGK